MDFSNAVNEFVADLELAGRSERTRGSHQLELQRLGRWLDEHGHNWQSIERRELQGYARLRAGLGHSSRSNMFCTLRVFYRWSVEFGYVALSPAAGFKTPAKPQPLPRALSVEQIKTLLCWLREQSGRRARRDEALVLTALYAGLRAAELAGLRWPAVDLAGGSINIRLSKMNRGRSVHIHPALASALDSWREHQALDGDVPVFSLDGRLLRPNRAGKICRRIAKETGLPLTTHALRHSFATWSLRRSGNLFSVSKALGHSELKQTQIYLASDTRDSEPAVDSLPDLDSW
jgi:site-specific recombinase XerC